MSDTEKLKRLLDQIDNAIKSWEDIAKELDNDPKSRSCARVYRICIKGLERRRDLALNGLPVRWRLNNNKG